MNNESVSKFFETFKFFFTNIFLVTDRESIELMNGSTIDYKQELIKKAFVVADNPLAQNGCSCGASFSIDL